MRSRHGRRITPWSTHSAPANRHLTARLLRLWPPCSIRWRPKPMTSRCPSPAPLQFSRTAGRGSRPSPGGRHHYLIARPEQKERVLETYVKLITTQPPPPPARGRRGGAAALMLGAAPSARACCSAPARISGQADEFETAVQPVLTQTCVQCHGEQRPAGGMSVSGLTSSESLVQHRDVWEAILRRLRAGDMPPAGHSTPRCRASCRG